MSLFENLIRGIHKGILPSPSSELWEVTNTLGWSLAHSAALLGKINSPNYIHNFKYWDLKNPDGDTVAHIAARNTTFPNDFRYWDLLNGKGQSVAYISMINQTIPKNFSHWDVLNDNGNTIAHEAVLMNCLPKDFAAWEITNTNGITVAEFCYNCNLLPQGKTFMHVYSSALDKNLKVFICDLEEPIFYINGVFFISSSMNLKDRDEVLKYIERTLMWGIV
ncbi:MAG: hypothetical protein D6735_02910 [Acidobacteria bacterium]|nr:MAG: hypothetical protein D6735_02910 [Acidobacteriota bacterium]